MRIKIIKCSKSTYWYANRINTEYDAIYVNEQGQYFIPLHSGYVRKCDCEIVPENLEQLLLYQDKETGKLYNSIKEYEEECLKEKTIDKLCEFAENGYQYLKFNQIWKNRKEILEILLVGKKEYIEKLKELSRQWKELNEIKSKSTVELNTLYEISRRMVCFIESL